MVAACLPVLLTGVLVAVLAGGCSGRADKAGGRIDLAPTVLRVVLPLGGETAGSVFGDRVAQLSGHRLVVDLREDWQGADPNSAESDAIEAVRAGTFDIGIVPVRAWDVEGVLAFDALDAPLEIDSVALAQAVAGSDVASAMLDALTTAGVNPLGLLPGPITRLAGVTREPSSPDALRGARLALAGSVVADRVVRALGAVPVHSRFGGASVSAMDGLILQVDAIHGGGYEGVVHTVVANLPLWSRSLVVFGNNRAMQRLPPGSVALLQRAARDAIAPTARSVEQREADAVASMCVSGRMAFVELTAAEVAAFRERFTPVYAWLSRDPFTRSALARIDAIKKQMPDEEPLGCKDSDTSGGSAVATPTASGGPAGAATSTPASTPEPTPGPLTPLDGVWEMDDTAKDGVADGIANSPDEVAECNYGTFRWVFSHGLYRETQHAGSTDTWATGTIVVDGDEFTLHVTDAGGSGKDGDCHLRAGDEFTWKWSVYHDRLTITWPDPAAAKSDFPANYAVKPWVRIGDAPATVKSTH